MATRQLLGAQVRTAPEVITLKPWHSIIVGYDGFDQQERVPDLAVSLAEEFGATLRVVHVLPPRASLAPAAPTVSARELWESLLEHRRATLDELLDPIRALGVDAESALREGIPHIELIRDAAESKADLLVVVDELTNREGGRSFGATTMKLLRDCPCPVLAKRSIGRSGYRRIMAAVDVGPEGSPENIPNRAIMDMATELARRNGAELVVLHAWSLWCEQTLKWRAGIAEVEMEELRAEVQRTQGRYLDELLGHYPMDEIAHRIVLTRGLPRHVVPLAIADHDVDLLVMGTVSRTGIPGFVIGNTAERILNSLDCSVVTIKPDGFVSPVLPQNVS